MDTPTDSPATLAQRLLRGFLALVISVVLYALSIGPLYAFFPRILFHGSPNREPEDGPLLKFYYPLIYVIEEAGLNKAMNSYMGWWCDVATRLHAAPAGGY